MEIGIDSFAAAPPGYETGTGTDNAKALAELLERIEFADKVGLDVFGIGEHHRKEFLDAAPAITDRHQPWELTKAGVIIGPNANKSLVLDIPFFVSDMSFGALSREAKIALSKESAYTS